jgi:hypothetical protein
MSSSVPDYSSAVHSTHIAIKGALLAKPNYQFEKRQRDLAKKKKQEEKRQKKVADKSAEESGNDAVATPPDAGSATEAPPDSGPGPEA